jgi:prolyl-tRNA synthetase
VTHHRLRSAEWGGVEVDPDSKLEEELIIRPTSETIIWKTYKNWITSHRDLPLLINQWANVVRREMRTRIFLRTAEFLRQEWHTAHATAQEAKEETAQMLEVYYDLMKNYLAIDGYKGVKSPSETFAWAEYTLTIEAMMQDKKALQSCTSHFLWQNFAKAFDVTFTNRENEDELVWATSWGLSTRIMWGLIMSHSDDQWLVLPPAIAPLHVVIVPIFKTEEDLDAITQYLFPVFESLEWMSFDVDATYHTSSEPVRYKIDDDDHKSPWRKFAQYEMQWVPLRVAIWKRDMENWVLEITRRDTWEKQSVEISVAGKLIQELLYDIQNNLLKKNQKLHTDNLFEVETKEEFLDKIENGFVLAHWDGSGETEALVKEKTKATIRCIPMDIETQPWVCPWTWNPSEKKVIFSKAY